ncbi:MAG: aspartate kinase, partial [Chitinophagaceae bacterium]
MKVMKFGGTSVGKPERMHHVASLITADQAPKIVVLSAVSGTTNALVNISTALSKSDRSGAKELIDSLEKEYKTFILSLVTTDAQSRAEEVLKEHFE